MTTYTMSIEQATEILDDVMSQPDWRNRLWRVMQAGGLCIYKQSGAPLAYSSTTKEGIRARAAYRIHQELSNPWKPFGKRGLESWKKRREAQEARRADYLKRLNVQF